MPLGINLPFQFHFVIANQKKVNNTRKKPQQKKKKKNAINLLNGEETESSYYSSEKKLKVAIIHLRYLLFNHFIYAPEAGESHM